MGLTSSSWCLAYEPAPCFLGSWIRTQLIRLKRLAGTEGVFWALCAGSVSLTPLEAEESHQRSLLRGPNVAAFHFPVPNPELALFTQYSPGVLIDHKRAAASSPPSPSCSVLSKREGSGSGASKHGFKNKRTGKVYSHILMNCQEGLPNLFSFSVSLSLLLFQINLQCWGQVSLWGTWWQKEKEEKKKKSCFGST